MWVSLLILLAANTTAIPAWASAPAKPPAKVFPKVSQPVSVESVEIDAEPSDTDVRRLSDEVKRPPKGATTAQANRADWPKATCTGLDGRKHYAGDPEYDACFAHFQARQKDADARERAGLQETPAGTPNPEATAKGPSSGVEFFNVEGQ